MFPSLLKNLGKLSIPNPLSQLFGDREERERVNEDKYEVRPEVETDLPEDPNEGPETDDSPQILFFKGGELVDDTENNRNNTNTNRNSESDIYPLQPTYASNKQSAPQFKSGRSVSLLESNLKEEIGEKEKDPEVKENIDSNIFSPSYDQQRRASEASFWIFLQNEEDTHGITELQLPIQDIAQGEIGFISQIGLSQHIKKEIKMDLSMLKYPNVITIIYI